MAIARDIALFVSDISQNSFVLGFTLGAIVTALITGFILSENPRHIPLILRYSKKDSYAHITKRNQHHHYNSSFEEFVKVYSRIRIVFYLLLTSFFIMITTMVVMYRPHG